MKVQVIWKWLVIAATASLGLWTRFPHAIQTLLMLMGLDVISGILASIRLRRLSSSVMVRGLVNKLAVFPLLALLHIVEQPLSLPFDLELIGALGFIVYEAMSIVENCANAGVPIPDVIVAALAKAKIKTASPEEIHSRFEQITERTSVKSEIVTTQHSSVEDHPEGKS